MTRSLTYTTLLSLTLALGACSSSQPTYDQPAYNSVHEGLLGTLWVQTAGEYEALSAQAFRQATDRMKEGLVDAGWTAALEQMESNTRGLPPAVIVDVDETMLDNSPYQAQLVADGGAFDNEHWNAWCRKAEAKALPGAKGFAREAAALGVTIFYVTNRDSEVEEATRANLESEGFPFPNDDTLDVLMTKGENDWGSDKTTRRAEVAKTHRILLLLGDDLNDFFSGARADNPEERRAIANEHRAMWGRGWIVLPNPLYGSWEASLFARDYGLSEEEKIERKSGYLETYE